MNRSGLTLLAATGLAPIAVAGQLEVLSTPAGGTVFLDDRYLGVTPLSLDVDATGAHLLRIEKRGYVPWRGTAELGGGPARAEAELLPETLGRISVSTEPDGADVYIDGRLVGKSPCNCLEYNASTSATLTRSGAAGQARRAVDGSAFSRCGFSPSRGDSGGNAPR